MLTLHGVGRCPSVPWVTPRPPTDGNTCEALGRLEELLPEPSQPRDERDHGTAAGRACSVGTSERSSVIHALPPSGLKAAKKIPFEMSAVCEPPASSGQEAPASNRRPLCLPRYLQLTVWACWRQQGRGYCELGGRGVTR